MISFFRKRFEKTERPGIYFTLGFTVCWMVIFISLPGRCGALNVKKLVDNVHYVDSIGSNFLFRGALPLTDLESKFNYEGLQQALIDATPPGKKLPENFYLIDLNLLQAESLDDARRIEVEHRFFHENQSLGKILVWGMRGTALSVNDQTLIKYRDVLALDLDNWLNDRLVERVEFLRGWLQGGAVSTKALKGKQPLPTVIYMHCLGGCDRTGELSGAYYLRYLRKSWKEVNQINREFCPCLSPDCPDGTRPFGCNNYRAVQWYCLWLNLKLGFTLNWEEEYSCS